VPKSEKKRHVIPFKVDDSELKALDRKAKELGLSRPEMIRFAIQKLTEKEQSRTSADVPTVRSWTG